MIIDLKNPDKQSLIRQWKQTFYAKYMQDVIYGGLEDYAFRKEGKHYVIYNKNLAAKRKAGTYKGDKQKQLKSQMKQQKFNYTKIPQKQTMFYMDLKDLRLISSQQYFKNEQQQKFNILHPMLISAYPICQGHCVIALFRDKKLPQFITPQVLKLSLHIFNFFKDVVIGYNSIGGGASVNHLHLQLICPKNLLGCKQMPIQKAQKIPWLNLKLQKQTSQIALYTLNPKQFETYGFILKYNSLNLKSSQRDNAINKLAFIFQSIMKEIQTYQIPHNLLISDNGNTIYLFLRDFSNTDCSYAWIEYSGAIVTSDQQEYKVQQAQILNKKKKLSIKDQLFEKIKNKVQERLRQFK